MAAPASTGEMALQATGLSKVFRAGGRGYRR
jgi:hypothetical protein